MKSLLAEGIGTFVLVFIGTGAVALNTVTSGLGSVGVAIAFGIAVLLMVRAFGRLSGAHINPAVTLGFRMTGAIGNRQALTYIVVQTAGALAASLCLYYLFPAGTAIGVTAPSLPVAIAFIFELLITAGLMWVILVIVHYPVTNGWLAGLGIGGWVAAMAFLVGPLTGASMNPARSLGPALVSGQMQMLWLYLVAPVIGAGVGVFFCRFSNTAGDCCRSRLASPAL